MAEMSLCPICFVQFDHETERSRVTHIGMCVAKDKRNQAAFREGLRLERELQEREEPAAKRRCACIARELIVLLCIFSLIFPLLTSPVFSD